MAPNTDSEKKPQSAQSVTAALHQQCESHAFYLGLSAGSERGEALPYAAALPTRRVNINTSRVNGPDRTVALMVADAGEVRYLKT